MVAARTRTPALVFAALMILSTVVVVVPTAAANHAVGALTTQLVVVTHDGVAVNLNASQVTFPVKIGDRLNLSTSFAPGECPPTNSVPGTITATANIAHISGTSTSAPMTRLGSASNPAQFYLEFTVESKPAAGSNGASTTIEVTANTQCVAGVGTVDQDTNTGGPSPFVLDNVPPAALISASPSTGTVGIGQTVTYTITAGIATTSNFTLHFADLNGSAPITGTLPTTQAVTLTATGKESAVPTGFVGDTAGNVAPITTFPAAPVLDTLRPALTSATNFTAKIGNGTEFTFRPGEADAANADLVKYTLRFQNATASIDIDCPKAGDADCTKVAGTTPPAYLVSGTPFTSNEAYTVTIRAFDEANNEASPAVTQTVTTAPYLNGFVELAVVGSTVGKVGSTINARLADLSPNVSRVTADLSDFGIATPLVWGTGSSFALTATQSFVVGTGLESPTLRATAFGPAGNEVWDATAPVRGFNGATTPEIDAKGPAVPGDFRLTAQADGTVKVDWTAPADSDLYGYNLTYTPTAGTPTTVAIPKADLTKTVSGLTSGTLYSFSLVGTDDVGNVGVAATGATTPTLQPIFAAIGETLPGRSWPTIAGTWTAADRLVPATGGGAGTITVAVNRSVPTGTTEIYWNPTTKAWQTAFVAADAAFTAGTSGSWTTSAFTDVTNGTGEGENNGNYTFTVKIKNATSGLEHSSTLRWHRDLVVPIVPTSGGKNAIVDDNPDHEGTMQERPILVSFAANDSGGLGTVNYTLVYPSSPFRSAVDLDGQLMTITCPTDPRCTGAPAVGTTNFDGTIGLRFLRVPFGDYRLNYTVSDRAGNVKWPNTTIATTIKVVPRVALAEGADTPGIASDGRLRLRGYAAWTGSEAFDQNGNTLGSCPGNVCRVAKVEYYVRQGTTGTGTLLGTEFIPVAGPDHSIDSVIKYYNYTPTTSFAIGSIDASNAFVQARATAYTSSATTSNILSQTPWVRVRTVETPGGLTVTRPFYDGGTFMDGQPKTTNFSVLLEQAGLSVAPTVNYTIRDATPGSANLGKYVYIHAAVAPSTSPLSVITNRTNHLQTGTAYWYNWSNNVTLAPGVYDLNVTVATPGNTQQATRRFTVEDDAPTIVGLTPISDIFQNKYVRNEFNFTVRVTHGNAGLNSSSLKLFLVDNAGQTVPDNQRVIETTLLDHPETLPLGTDDFQVRVRLPSTALDAARYDMRFNFTTEAVTTCACKIFSAVQVQSITLDAGPGTSAIDTTATRDSGKVLSSQLVVHGTATDAGTGVASVQVRVVNLTGAGSTWRVNGAAFIPGIQDGPEYYLTNTSTGALRVVSKARDSGGNEVATWTLLGGAGSTGVTFDRGSRYFIDVRVVDLAGFTSSWKNATVTFDGDAPTLSLFNFTGGVATNTVDWHGGGTFSAFAGDNACVDRVVLVVARGDGASASANFTRPAAATCSATTGNTVANWTIDLAANPNMTDYVGTNRYRVEAYDPVGNRVGLVQNITLTVRDVTAPIVRAVSFEPGTLGSGLPATVVADVFENANISRVEIYVAKRETPDTILGRGNMTPRNVTATGSGLWEARISDESGSQVNITLERGEYLFRIRPVDVNSAVTCPNNACATFDHLRSVVEGNPPQIVAKAPTGTFVSATPTFRYEILDLGLNASGVSIHTGYDGVLAEAPRSTLSFNETKGANNTVLGQVVTFTPATPLTDGPNFTVRVVVQSTRSGFRNTLDSTFTVDATPPSVAQNVTGTLPLNNKTYAVALTRVALNATDNETLSPAIRYRVNNGTEQGYNGPITPSGEDGEWRLEYWARDGAGNEAPKQVITLQIDRSGPRISVNSHGDVVVLTVNDDGVGVNDSTVTVHYRYGTTGTFTPLTAQRVAGGNSFRATLPGNASATGLSYYFTALDGLGNQGTNFSAAAPHTIAPKEDEVVTPPPPENEAPTVSITSPADGATVSGTVDIKWTAADPELATLTVIVARTNPDRVIMQPASDPGHYVWNLTGEPTGATTVVVTVIDGVHEITDSVTFNVVPRQTITLPRPIPQAPVQPGVGIPIEVSINPSGTTVASATYSLVRNGTTIPGGPLTRNAAGNYVAVASANQSGVYVVVIDVVYGNQTTETRAVGQFAVSGPVAPPIVVDAAKSFPVSLMALSAIAVLTIALAAYGAFGRWRK